MILGIVLTGYMGSGKTSVGRALAAQLGWDFVDTDDLVEQMAGRTVSDLFAEGENLFRLWERQAIATLVPRTRLVVATGAGAMIEEETRALLAGLGTVVCLDAPLEVLWERVQCSQERPLARDRELFAARLAVRRLQYDRFALAYDTSAGDPAALAAHIVQDLFGHEQAIPVALGDRQYQVTVAPGELVRLPAYLPGAPGPCLLVSDDGVPSWYLELALATLTLAGWRPALRVVPAGEASKSWEVSQQLVDAALRAGLHRESPIISLGGGMVGDLAGFVAATYMRGIPFMQVPTTLLAQVDASVGGKVAINHRHLKNLVGAFHQPAAVLVDPATLLTLPAREFTAGLGEVVKYALLTNDGLLEFLEAEAVAIAARSLPVLTTLVARCIAIKARIVAEDERERPDGPRAGLNLGHTLAHAIESVQAFGGLLHGEAVGLGLLLEARLAVARGEYEARLCERLEALLQRFALPTQCPPVDGQALIEAMGHDKKNRGEGIRMALPRAGGGASLAIVSEAEVWATLRA